MIDPVSSVRSSPTSGVSPTSGAELGWTRGPGPSAGIDGGTDFGAMLQQLTTDAANVVRQAEATSIAGVQGTASVQQVVEAVMAAEQTLQSAVAIRDKVVAAYLEISRMQI